jgi:hypothetical protein
MDLTWGHIFMTLAAIALVAALLYAMTWLKHRGFIYGTPQYARGRTARRSGVTAFIIALILAAIGCLTPLCNVAVV